LDAVTSNLGDYASGTWVTVQLTLLSFAAALALGTVVAVLRVSPVAPARAAGLLYVETVRNTPLAVLLVLFVFALPKVGITYPLFASGVVVLSAYTGAYVSEALRSGINSVAPGQTEAARAVGLGFFQTLAHVVLPQAFRTVVPPLGNLFIALTKNTAVVSTVAVLDLTGTADRLNTATAEPIPVFLGAGVAYLLLTLPSGLLVGAIERKVAIRR
jgi:glutamate transport system permease protein